MSKTCKRCGAMNLEWDRVYHDATGKWKLMEHKNKSGKWCGKVKQEVLSKVDAILCDLCSETSFGLCRSQEGYEQHLKKYHPNGEVLSELDYTHEFMSHYTLKTFWKHDPHYSKYAKDL